MDLAGFDARACADRRARLAARLPGTAALVASGAPRARNYAANIYPFRATSHFLYLFGLPLREAFGHFDGEHWAVYAAPPEPDAALWHGPEPALGDLAAALGCPVRPLDDLPAALGQRPAATLPAPDRETCAAQAQLLGRPVAPGALTAVDEPLADAVIDLRLQH